MTAPIQTIDLSPFTDFETQGLINSSELTPQQEKTAQQIDGSLRKNGFMFLSNLGLSKEALDRYYAYAINLFNLPNEYKMSNLKAIDQETNEGYIQFRREALNRKRSPDLKEAFNVCNRGNNASNFKGCPEGYPEAMKEMWSSLEAIAKLLQVVFAIALDLPRDFFTSRMTKCDSAVVRFIHYPPCEYKNGASSGEDAHSAIRVGEHTDFGLFTMLFNDGPGLQVKAREGDQVGMSTDGAQDEWMDVPVPSDATVIVNTGALLARWTNDKWQAAPHRVIVVDETVASMDRYAIACFWDPDKDALVEIDSKFVPAGEKPRYPSISGGEYIKMRLNEALGYSVS